MSRSLMLLAEIDIDAEFYRLFRLLIAICQPLLVVALCLGFAAASIHLLTMLATTWGNRRVSAKAMIFSVSVHLCLFLGLVALIPEARRRVWAAVLPDKDQEIRVAVSVDPNAIESATPGQGGLQARLNTPTSPIDSTFTRTDRAPDPFVDSTPEIRRPETLASLPDIAPSDVAPPPVEVTPEKIAATESVLQEFATATLTAPATTENPLRPDQELARPQFARSTPVNAPPDESVTVERPTRGGVDRIGTPTLQPVEPKSLNEPTSENATIARRNDDDIARRVGMAPTAPSATPLTGQETPEQTRPDARPGPVIARNTIPSPVDSPGFDVERPRVMTEGPTTEFTPSTISTVPSLAPANSSETPFLARVETAPADGQLPATYQLRTPGQQGQAVRQFGGSDESEKAVVHSLAFLAKAQKEDGHWDVGFWEGGLLTKNPDGAPRVFRSVDLDTGVTALATLAFLGKLNTLSEGEYSDNVRRATRWLVAQQKPGGFIGNDPGGEGRDDTVPGNMAGMYGHAMATFALAEAYAMSRDHQDARQLRTAVERGIAFILAAQLEDGGWRYFQYQLQGGDMSIFGWQLMALKSAQLGGVPIPPRVRDRMIDFLRKNSRGTHGGLGAYRTTSPTTPAMTAEALYCRQILGAGRDSESSKEAVEYLLSYRNLPSRQKFDLYYWYYGTLAMFQYGGNEWQQWNLRVRDLLVSEQVKEGPYAGSWEPRDPWSGYGGRIYATAIATLSLEVYYRYLPLYKENSGGSESSPASVEPTPKSK